MDELKSNIWCYALIAHTCNSALSFLKDATKCAIFKFLIIFSTLLSISLYALYLPLVSFYFYSEIPLFEKWQWKKKGQVAKIDIWNFKFYTSGSSFLKFCTNRLLLPLEIQNCPAQSSVPESGGSYREEHFQDFKVVAVCRSSFLSYLKRGARFCKTWKNQGFIYEICHKGKVRTSPGLHTQFRFSIIEPPSCKYLSLANPRHPSTQPPLVFSSL